MYQKTQAVRLDQEQVLIWLERLCVASQQAARHTLGAAREGRQQSRCSPMQLLGFGLLART